MFMNDSLMLLLCSMTISNLSSVSCTVLFIVVDSGTRILLQNTEYRIAMDVAKCKTFHPPPTTIIHNVQVLEYCRWLKCQI
jgi:hypothetical protein